jgi:hypothetical protein
MIVLVEALLRTCDEGIGREHTAPTPKNILKIEIQ